MEREGLEQAVFAGGCFWGVEAAFAAAPGVVATECGYTGGREPRPTYSRVCGGRTGHAEAVRVWFDPRAVSYERLLAVFFEEHNPTRRKHKPQYRSALWAHSPAQAAAAAAAVADLEARFGVRVLTELRDAERWPFWEAEERHQQYNAKRAAKLRALRGDDQEAAEDGGAAAACSRDA